MNTKLEILALRDQIYGESVICLLFAVVSTTLGVLVLSILTSLQTDIMACFILVMGLMFWTFFITDKIQLGYLRIEYLLAKK